MELCGSGLGHIPLGRVMERGSLGSGTSRSALCRGRGLGPRWPVPLQGEVPTLSPELRPVLASASAPATAGALLSLACSVSSHRGPGDERRSPSSTICSWPLLGLPWDHHSKLVPTGGLLLPLNSVPVHGGRVAGIIRGVTVRAGAGTRVKVLVEAATRGGGQALQVGYCLGFPASGGSCEALSREPC